MKNHNPSTDSDIEICKAKIVAILKEYNCSIHDCDGWLGCYIIDNDTKERLSFP